MGAGEGGAHAVDKARSPVRSHAPKRVSARRFFYSDAMSACEREELPAAYEMEGLEDEIAALRVRLRTAMREHPEDFRLMLQGMGMLVRAVAAQYRLSPKARRQLADSLAAVLNALGDHILPADQG